MSASPTPLDDADPLCRLSAAELGASYASGRLSPVEVAKACLDRCEAVQQRFNAFTRIEHEGALAAAQASEARWREGAPVSAVDGVPTTIKDIVWVEGWSIRYGSPTTSATPYGTDAPAVARLRAAGTIFLGLTTTPEFGWKAVTDSRLSGITRNPWNPAMTPGGSSGGAAVAAATGAGVFHLGTDGGGSIRVPASFTGISGLKPTYGRVPAYPASAFGTVAHLGPMTRRVADTKAMLRAMSGRDPQDWLQGPGQLPTLDPNDAASFRGMRVGYWSKPPCGTLDPEVKAAVKAAVQAMASLGAIVEKIDLPGENVLKTFNTLWFSGAASRASQLSAEEADQLEPGLRAAVEIGKGFSSVDYIRAMAERAAFGLAMDHMLERYDVLLSPATAIPAFEAGLEVPPGSGMAHWTEWAGFNFPLNLSQQPAISVPCGRTASGLPIGLQIVGARGADAHVLAVAAAFEESFPHHFI